MRQLLIITKWNRYIVTPKRICGYRPEKDTSIMVDYEDECEMVMGFETNRDRELTLVFLDRMIGTVGPDMFGSRTLRLYKSDD